MKLAENSAEKLMRGLFEIKRLYLNAVGLIVFIATTTLMLQFFELFSPIVAGDPFKAFICLFALWAMAITLIVFFYFGEGVFLIAMALAASSLIFVKGMIVAAVILGFAGAGVSVFWRYFRSAELKNGKAARGQ